MHFNSFTEDPSCPRAGKESRSLSVLGKRCLDEKCNGEVALVRDQREW